MLSSKLCHPVDDRTTALTVRTGVGARSWNYISNYLVGVGVVIVSRMPKLMMISQSKLGI